MYRYHRTRCYNTQSNDTRDMVISLAQGKKQNIFPDHIQTTLLDTVSAWPSSSDLCFVLWGDSDSPTIACLKGDNESIKSFLSKQGLHLISCASDLEKLFLYSKKTPSKKKKYLALATALCCSFIGLSYISLYFYPTQDDVTINKEINYQIHTAAPVPASGNHIELTPTLTIEYSNSPKVDTSYPNRFSPYAFDQYDISGWKTILPHYNKKTDTFLILPRQGMIAPIHTLDTQNNDNKKQPLDLLEDGLVMHQESISPRMGTGTTIIAGHSSYRSDNQSNFKTIMQVLPYLHTGDTIVLVKQSPNYDKNIFYQYRITQQAFIIDPDNPGLLQGEVGKKIISLYGCYPFGSLKKRIVVQAEFTSETRRDM